MFHAPAVAAAPKPTPRAPYPASTPSTKAAQNDTVRPCAQLNADTDRVATRLQATAFNACCAVYAPRYRQASGLVYTHPSADGDAAAELAYRDIEAAFQRYLERSGDRPFMLAAHSQGSMHALRLLRERIAPTALRGRLVAAYLIGAPIPKNAVDLPICADPQQVGCIVSYNARAPGYTPNQFELRPPPTAAPTPLICVNPITWTLHSAATAEESRGAVFLEADPPAVLPRFASAQCEGDVLVVTERQAPPRDLMSRLLDHTLGPGNLHSRELQIFWLDLRHNAQTRATAHLNALSAPR